MEKSKDRNLRREKPLFIRLTTSEKEVVRRKSKSVGLSMDEYARCRLFDIPFEHVSGRVKYHRAQRGSESHKHPVEATNPTA